MKNGNFHALVILLGLCLMAAPVSAGEVTCNSPDGELTRCSLPHADRLKVKLKRRVDGICKFQQSWGVDPDGVWVDMGCSAVFQYASPLARQIGWKRFLPAWAR
jgi:Protein of unknown function (DUF3011)